MSHSDGNRLFKIDLDRSRAPRAYRDGQNLWRDDLTRIYRLLQRQVDALKMAEEREESAGHYQRDDAYSKNDRPHLSIAIFGPSGSGKSSLIRTLADDVTRSFDQILPETLEKTVATLPVMNPTTWGRNDQFLYAFLASALEEERNKQERKEHGFPQGLSPVQLAFQEVNEYLRVVDDPERSEEHDPLGLSLQKLERHTSGLRLRNALGDLIEKLTRELRSEIVLLPVDDLDMAPDHLVNALQSYQSYLMHPRLVPVFTFTDRMPEELIEVYYKAQLGEAASHERLGGSNRLSISEQMAVQFLARCFPVRNRIRLGPAPARVQRATYFVRNSKESHRKPDESPVLELLTQSSLLLFGYPDAEDAHKIRAALRPSTLRRQLQVADAMSDSHVAALRTPQSAVMAGLDEKALPRIAQSEPKKLKSLPQLQWPEGEEEEGLSVEKKWDEWKKRPRLRRRIATQWPKLTEQLNPPKKSKGEKDEECKLPHEYGHLILARNLRKLDMGATWTTLFNRATWALLNVHRDTLRELGLFLEDLYSWSPKELRSVVLENILAQDLATRRTVVDRWFNRTDYRRSQVLSLLAANVFRPWMAGEEPFGDEEMPIREQMRQETELKDGGKTALLDHEWGDVSESRGDSDDRDKYLESEQRIRQIRERLTLRAPKGMLWFLNVTLGFYLPQIMARNWDSGALEDMPIKARMSGGNGWDLHHAATNAVRIADAKKEVFSFGTVFLDPAAFRQALEMRGDWSRTNHRPSPRTQAELEETIEIVTRKYDYIHEWIPDELVGEENGEHEQKKSKKELEEDKKNYFRREKSDFLEAEVDRHHLLLRLWSCHGYSSGRYWAAFSLWRGLSFIGQAVEIGIKHHDVLRDQEDCGVERFEAPVRRTYVEPENPALKALHVDLFRLIRTHGLQGLSPGSLLSKNSDDTRLLKAFPKWEPRGDLEDPIKLLVADLADWLKLCWNDRVFPLPAGDIWLGWKDCFVRRIHGEYVLGGLWPRLNSAYLEEYREPKNWALLGRYWKKEIDDSFEDWWGKYGAKTDRAGRRISERDVDRFRWSAAIAAGAWSDLLLEYWRGCPPMLKMLLTCPVMFKSNDRFGDPNRDDSDLPKYQKNFVECMEFLKGPKPEEVEKWSIEEKKEHEQKRQEELSEDPRLSWLYRIGLPRETWREVEKYWQKKWGPQLVPVELAIPRVEPSDFTVPGETHHAVRLHDTTVEIEGPSGKSRISAARDRPADDRGGRGGGDKEVDSKGTGTKSKKSSKSSSSRKKK